MSRRTPAAPSPIPPAPGGLSASSEAIWYELAPTRAKSLGRRLLLAEFLLARDRLAECRSSLATLGLTSTTARSGTVHVHPLARMEHETAARFVKLAALLGLDWHDAVDGRV